jgi:DNA-directed RNA polymerase subunit RPC12/RpoP
MSIERIPAQIIYECDRCLDRQRISEGERIGCDHPLSRWVTIIIAPVHAGEFERSIKSRSAYLCGRCVSGLGTPFEPPQDEAPPF